MIDDRFFTGLLPACTDPSLKYYPSHGLYFENTEDAWSAVKEGLNNGNRIFQCQFANEELRNAFIEDATNGRYSQMAYDIMGYQGRWGANYDANQSCTLNIWLADS